MAKLLFKIQDLDSKNKQITGTLVQRDDFWVDPNKFIETEKEDEFNEIKKLLEKGAKITLPKNTESLEEKIVENMPEMESKKIKAYELAANQLKQRLENSLALLDYYEMMILQNELMDRGYHITNNNREQIYLDILNTENEIDLNILERYLEARDNLEQHRYFYAQFRLKFIKKLRVAMSDEEIDKALQEFLSIF